MTYDISDMFIDVSNFVDEKTTIIESCQTKTYHQIIYGFTLIDAPMKVAMKVKFSNDYYYNFSSFYLQNKYLTVLSENNKHTFINGDREELLKVLYLFRLVYSV